MIFENAGLGVTAAVVSHEDCDFLFLKRQWLERVAQSASVAEGCGGY